MKGYNVSIVNWMNWRCTVDVGDNSERYYIIHLKFTKKIDGASRDGSIVNNWPASGRSPRGGNGNSL